MNSNKLVTLIDNEDHYCMICGDKTKNVKTLGINRKKDGNNICAFGCCKTCMRILGTDIVDLSFEYD